MDSIVYNQKGEQVGKVTLPESVFGTSFNPDLVHQVAISLLSGRRKGTAHAKSRGEVRGGGRKPWRQKGTGRARHGSIRSPIWVGGGVTHGPRNDKNYFRKVNKQMKRKAVLSVLSSKFKERELLLVDNFVVPEIKTKDAKQILTGLSGISNYESLVGKRKNAALILIPAKNHTVIKSFRNIGNIKVEETRNLNILDLLQYKFLIITDPTKSLSIIERVGSR